MKTDPEGVSCAKFGNAAAAAKLGGDTRNASPYLTTPEAAAYLRKSVSWLLRQHDIPFVPGNPNVYRRSDLDQWFDRSKVAPRIA